MSDLRIILRGDESHRERELAGVVMAAEDVQAVRRRADRRRARRQTMAGLLTVGIVAVAGVATWAVWNGLRSEEPIAPLPSPSVTVELTPSPSPDPSPEPLTMPDFAGGVTEHPYLPSAQEITPEAWNAARSGWVLATVLPEWWEDEVSLKGPQVVYLISPGGDRYQLVSLGDDVTVHVILWEPQSTTAIVTVAPNDFYSPDSWAWLDLVTGALEPLDTDAIPAEFPAWRSVDGHMLVAASASEFLDHWTIDMNGAFEYVDFEDRWRGALLLAYEAFPAPRDSTFCRVLAEHDQVSAVVRCLRWDEEFFDQIFDDPWLAGTRMYRSWNDGSGRIDDLGRYGEDTYEPGGWAWVIGDTVTLTAGDWHPLGCPAGNFRLDGGQLVELPGSAGSSHPNPTIFTPLGVSGTSVYTLITSGCAGDVSPTILVRDDLAGGTFVELVSHPQFIGDPGSVDTLRSAFVVP